MLNDEKESKLVKSKETVPAIFSNRFDIYPENNRRPVNKTVYKNKYFNLVYETSHNSLKIVNQGDIVYSAIPYDTGRRYIQMAAIQFILHPTEAEQYIRKHKPNIEKYLSLAIMQSTGEQLYSDSFQIQNAYDQIFKDTLFEIQIMGRMLQHDETGPMSANLAGKFIYSKNLKTGISEYLAEYLEFVIETTKSFPIITDGSKISLIEENYVEKKTKEIAKLSEINKDEKIRQTIINELSSKRRNLVILKIKQNYGSSSWIDPSLHTVEDVNNLKNEIKELENIVVKKSNNSISISNLLDIDVTKIASNEKALAIYDKKIKNDIDKEKKHYNEMSITGNSDISKGLARMPKEIRNSLYKAFNLNKIEESIKRISVKEENDNVLIRSHSYKTLKVNDDKSYSVINDTDGRSYNSVHTKGPILKSERGKEIKDVKKNYVAHSIDPKKLEQYFENILPTDNINMINVVSDIHSQNKKLPLTNKDFNILVGDISDSQVKNSEIKGIYVIGNHELVDVLSDKLVLRDKKWDQFRTKIYFQKLILDPNTSWPFLPLDMENGKNNFYNRISDSLAPRFPKMKILNNESYVYKGVRYIGITLPVVLTKRKKEVQEYIVQKLEPLLEEDSKIPTVIVSHAPLFNELSMLSPKSKAFNKEYTCDNQRIVEIFKEYNIIGVIHGHHHIPASSGRSKKVKFAGKEMFVLCSIYSHVNTGFELNSLL